MLDHEKTRGQDQPAQDVDDWQVPVLGLVKLEEECYDTGWRKRMMNMNAVSFKTE